MMLNKLRIYSKLKNSVKAALWFTICNFLQKAISMITLPIFTRLLTTEQYGVFSVYQSWYQIVSIIVTLNLSGAVVNNGLVKYKDDQDGFISSLQGLSSTLTISFFIVYICGLRTWNNIFGLSSIFLVIMFIQLLFEPAYLFWMQKKRFEFSYRSVVTVTLIISFLSPVFGIIAVIFSSYKAEARVISYAFVQICAGVVFFIIQAKKGKKIYSKDYWAFALRFNLPLVPHYLSQVILGQADRLMINQMVGADKTAIYSVVYTISSMMTLLINAINSSYIPTLYQHMINKRYKEINISSKLLCTTMAGAVSAIILIGPEVISILAPLEYREAIWLVPPVAASVFFTYLYTLFINIEFYYEKTQYTMVVSVVGAFLNIVLNYILILRFGYIAAGYTTLCCYILFALCHYLLDRRIFKRNNIEEKIFDGKYLLWLSIFFLVLSVVSNVLYIINFARYILFAIALILLVIFRKKIYKLVMNAIK